MGKTAFMGPVYGAKSLIWSFFATTGSSNGASTAIAAPNSAITVPVYEDWFATEAVISVSTHSSVAQCVTLKLKTEGGSSGLPPRPWNGNTTNAATILTADQGTTSTSWSTRVTSETLCVWRAEVTARI